MNKLSLNFTFPMLNNNSIHPTIRIANKTDETHVIIIDNKEFEIPRYIIDSINSNSHSVEMSDTDIIINILHTMLSNQNINL